MKACIYARYSSSAQNERSIEGQVEDCQRYARDNDIEIVAVYADRAKTGLSDDRPDFQKMIAESSLGLFEAVLVWKLDRFARNALQSYKYEDILEKNGVKLISYLEPIADGAAGTLTKGIFRTIAQYYSEDLKEKVERGMRIKAEKGQSTGGTVPYGYKLVNGVLEVEPFEAAAVRQVFEEYAASVPLRAVADELNGKGYRTRKGQLFHKGSFATMLRNKKYIGVYHYNGIELEGAVPSIVPKETFDAVQERFEIMAGRNGRACAKVPYLLSGKIFCGKCGHLMGGESTNKNGTQYNYYACSQKKKYRACDKKNVPKDYIETAVVKAAVELLTDDYIAELVTLAAKEARDAAADSSELEGAKRELKDARVKISNIVKAISSGVCSQALTDELHRLEQLAADLDKNIKVAEAERKVAFDVDAVTAFLYRFRGGDIDDFEFRRAVCTLLVQKVIVFDDHLDIYYNYNETKQAPPRSVDISNLAGNGSPQKSRFFCKRRVFCYL